MKLKLSNIAVATLLAACTTNGAAPQMAPLVANSTGIYAQSNEYQRTVALQIAGKDLEKSAKKILASTQGIQPAPSLGISEFTLTLEGSVQAEKSTAFPRLVGQLLKGIRKDIYVLTYALHDRNGQAMTQGKTVTELPPYEVVYPATQVNYAPSSDILDSVIQQLIPQLLPHIQASPWQAQVLSHVDASHITMSAGAKGGIRIGDIFKTATLPVSVLQVVMFENVADGGNRAVLRLLQGPIPRVGKPLVPA